MYNGLITYISHTQVTQIQGNFELHLEKLQLVLGEAQIGSVIGYCSKLFKVIY